jgi:hypothetical protein
VESLAERVEGWVSEGEAGEWEEADGEGTIVAADDVLDVRAGAGGAVFTPIALALVLAALSPVVVEVPLKSALLGRLQFLPSPSVWERARRRVRVSASAGGANAVKGIVEGDMGVAGMRFSAGCAGTLRGVGWGGGGGGAREGGGGRAPAKCTYHYSY